MRDRRPTSGWISRAAWLVVWLAVGWSVLWLFAGRWLFFDVLLSFQAQVLGMTAALIAVCLAFRRWRCSLVLGLAFAVGSLPLVFGRSVTLPGVDVSVGPAAGTIRFVSFNVDPENKAWRDDLDAVFSWSPDIVVLIETSPDFWRAVVQRDELEGTEWSRFVRRYWVDDLASPCYILSRWPIEKLEFAKITDADRDVCIARVDHPDGALLVGAIHPHSPRTLWRWRQGNQQLRTTGVALDAVLGADAPPFVAGVDLNSGPAGARAGWLRGWGLSMSKPVLGGWGSFPADVPAIARVQLDDVWHSDGVEVVAWSSPGGLASDHRPVVVDVRLER